MGAHASLGCRQGGRRRDVQRRVARRKDGRRRDVHERDARRKEARKRDGCMKGRGRSGRGCGDDGDGDRRGERHTLHLEGRRDKEGQEEERRGETGSVEMLGHDPVLM